VVSVMSFLGISKELYPINTVFGKDLENAPSLWGLSLYVSIKEDP